MPAGHDWQTDAPGPLKEPAGHGWHDAEIALSANVPALHCAHDVPGVDEVEPAPQGVQAVLPTVFVTEPFWQGKHGDVPPAP